MGRGTGLTQRATAALRDAAPHPVAAEIVRLYVEQELSVAAVAARVGMSGKGVRGHLKRAGVTLRPRGRPVISDADLQAARDAYQEAGTIAGAAKLLGVGYNAAHERLKRSGALVAAPAAGRDYQRILAELRDLCAGRSTFPTKAEFKQANRYPLFRAVAETGGAAHWAPRVGLPIRKPGRAADPLPAAVADRAARLIQAGFARAHAARMVGTPPARLAGALGSVEPEPLPPVIDRDRLAALLTADSELHAAYGRNDYDELLNVLVASPDRLTEPARLDAVALVGVRILDSAAMKGSAMRLMQAAGLAAAGERDVEVRWRAIARAVDTRARDGVLAAIVRSVSTGKDIWECVTLEFLDRAYPDADRLVGALLRQRAIYAGDDHMRLLFGDENFARMRNRLDAAGGNNRSVAEQLSAKAWGRMVRERADWALSRSIPYLISDLATEYHRANPVVDDGRRRPVGSADALSASH